VIDLIFFESGTDMIACDVLSDPGYECGFEPETGCANRGIRRIACGRNFYDGFDRDFFGVFYAQEIALGVQVNAVILVMQHVKHVAEGLTDRDNVKASTGRLFHTPLA
jgi:hypothetical protein